MRRVDLKNRSEVRFGLHLRPPYAMAQAQAEIHDLIARQYGSTTAGKFMPHATIKGFFWSDAPVTDMVRALDPVMAKLEPFDVVNGGIIPFGGNGSIVIDVHHNTTGSQTRRCRSCTKAWWPLSCHWFPGTVISRKESQCVTSSTLT